MLYRQLSGGMCCVYAPMSIPCRVNCIFRQVAGDLFTLAVIFLTQLPWLSGSGSPERKSDARPFFPFSSHLINDTDRTLNVVKLIFLPITRRLTVERVSYSHQNERYTYIIRTILCHCSFFPFAGKQNQRLVLLICALKYLPIPLALRATATLTLVF